MASKIFNSSYIELILKHQIITMLKNKITLGFIFENTYTLKYGNWCKTQSRAVYIFQKA